MTHRALTLLAVIGVAFAAAGLLFAGAANASSHSATRSINPASVAAGGTVTVTIAVTDLGFAGLVTETLPEGFSYVSSSLADSQIGEDGQIITLFAFGEDSFTYTVTASNDAGDYSFSGTVEDDNDDVRDVGGDTDVTVTAAPATPTAEPTEEPTAEPAGPSATRSFSSSTVEAGGMLDVTITAADYGDTGLVTETLPEGFSYVSSSPSGLGADSGQEVSFVLIDLEDDTFTYTVTASDVAGTYSFSGTLADFEKTDVAVGGASSVTVEGPRASRALSSTAVAPGGQLRVTIRANDYGQSGLVHETLPNGFTYVSSSPEGIAEVNGQVVSFVLLGEDMSFRYTVDAPEMLGDYTFSGELEDFEKDTYPVGGLSSVTVAELPPTALRTISDPTVVEGERTNVTIIALNYGRAGTLVENLPAGLEYVSSNMADALIVNGQTLTYTLVGNNLSVTYTVEASQTGTQVISGYLEGFDRRISLTGGANTVTVRSARQPSTGGGTYSGPDPTATPVPTATAVPPTATAVPPTATAVPPTATAVPPTATAVPPTATAVPPTATSVPPTATSVPPTATSVPPTATSVPPTATSVPPTATSVPPTATAVPPTATSVPPTATSVPPTATAVPPAPTATAVPPTATAVPPTATSVPPAPTATSVPPAPTATSVPPTVVPAPTPAPTATVVPPPVEEEGGGFPAWAIILIILAVIVVAAGAVVYARQRMMAQQQQA